LRGRLKNGGLISVRLPTFVGFVTNVQRELRDVKWESRAMGNPFRRNPRVRCVDCGFLTYDDFKFLGQRKERLIGLSEYEHAEYERIPSEVTLKMRSEEPDVLLASGARCYRNAFDLPQEIETLTKESNDRVAEYPKVVERERDCAFFFEHVPGYTPQAHLELQERKRLEFSRRIWDLTIALVSAAVGAAIAIVATRLA